MKTSTKKMTSVIRQLSLGAGLSVFAAGAFAVGPITQFTVVQEFEFTAASPLATTPGDTTTGVVMSGESGAANGPIFGQLDGRTKLAWGNPVGVNPSSLVINPGADLNQPTNALSTAIINVVADNGLPIVDVDFELGPQVVHNNWVINAPSLDTATAQDHVTLTANGNVQTQGPMFDINFQETTNALGNGDAGASCPSSYYGTDGTDGFKAWDAVNGCGDIFVLDTTQLVPTLVNEINPVDPGNPVVAFLIDSFAIDGFNYDVYLREVSGLIAPLSTAACTAAGSTAGCIGMVTRETQSNIFALAFGIVSSERIPAPATLFLMGGSLLSMAWFRRRKSVKTA